MYSEDPDAKNTWDNPDRIVPRANPKTKAEKGTVTAVLKKASWNVLRFEKK